MNLTEEQQAKYTKGWEDAQELSKVDRQSSYEVHSGWLQQNNVDLYEKVFADSLRSVFETFADTDDRLTDESLTHEFQCFFIAGAKVYENYKKG